MRKSLRFSWKETYTVSYVGQGIVVLLALLYSRIPLPTMYLLAAPALVFGFVTFLKFPETQIYLLVISSFLIPFSIGTGTQTRINIVIILSVLLIGLWLIRQVVLRIKLLLLLPEVTVPLICFIFFCIVSFAVGQLPWITPSVKASLPSQLGGLLIVLLSGGVFFFTAYNVIKLEWLQRLIWIFMFIGCGYLLSRAFPFLGNAFGFIFQNDSTGSMFWIWMISISLSQVLINRSLRTHQRIFLLVVFFLAVFVAFFQGRSWVSGWLPGSIAIFVVIWFWERKARLPLVILLALFFILFSNNLIGRLMADEEWSLVTRLQSWRIIANIISTSPVLGLGPANYFWYTDLHQLMGYYVKFPSHNQYIDLIAQFGILGLISYLWFLLALWRRGGQLLKSLDDSFSRAYVIGALAGIAALIVAGYFGDWIFPFVYNLGLDGFRASVFGWIFMGGLVSVDKLHQA